MRLHRVVLPPPARVFLKNPPILILDEATSALDNESEILVGQTGRLDDLLPGRAGLAVSDVVRHRAAEEVDLLLDDADVLPQALEGDVLDVLPVDEDAASRHLVEAGDEVAQGRLAAAGGSDQRQTLIARVFRKTPPILILDEATSALDNESEILVGQSLVKLAHGRTTLTIAHA